MGQNVLVGSGNGIGKRIKPLKGIKMTFDFFSFVFWLKYEFCGIWILRIMWNDPIQSSKENISRSLFCIFRDGNRLIIDILWIRVLEEHSSFNLFKIFKKWVNK